MFNVDFIIDIDGFPVGGSIFYKEVAIYNCHNRNVHLYHIKLPKSLIADGYHRKEVRFCTKNIHGMLLKNFHNDISYEEFIKKIVEMDPNKEKIWSYKGGIVERKLLNSLYMKHLNLETLGCPRFDQLLGKYNVKEIPCNRHTAFSPYDKSRIVHCSGYEVKVFGCWLVDACGEI